MNVFELMKNIKLISITLLLLSLLSCNESSRSEEASSGAEIELIESSFTSDAVMRELFDEERSDEQVCVQGNVSAVLADDNNGARHQRFILQLNSGQTILVAHNIDLAERIDAIDEGDHIEVYGEYEWNDRGGVIHWTHLDPQNRHIGGWIKHNSELFQ